MVLYWIGKVQNEDLSISQITGENLLLTIHDTDANFLI